MVGTVPKVAIITGRSSGVGLALTLKLAQQGWKVWATMRDVTKSSELMQGATTAQCQGNITVDAMDVNDDASVEASVQRMLESYGPPGVLVNNAGYSLFGTVEMVSMEQCRQQFETNFFGVVRTTKAVMPHLRQQRAGRIVNVSSVGGLMGQPFNDLYCASKFAVEGFTESQAALFRDFGIYVSLCEPGPIRSKFSANSHRPDMTKVPSDYHQPLQLTMAAFGRMFKDEAQFQTPEEIADSIIANGIDHQSPPLRFQPNESTAPIVRLTDADPTGEAQVRHGKETYLMPAPE